MYKVKKSELEKKLKNLGWFLKRQGSNHEIWTNGEDTEAVPRHNEINEHLARKIIRNVKNNPAKED